MKKITLITFCTLLFTAACTSPEQDEKIKSFWQGQAMNVMMRVAMAKSRFSAAGSNDFSKHMAEALQNVRANQTQPQEQQVQPQPAPKPRQASTPEIPAMLEVTMEEEALPGRAEFSERKLMKQALDEVQINNHTTLQDLQTVFGESVKVKAFLITNSTETELKKVAARANTYEDYLARQEELLQKQQLAIEQLMEQNKSHMRRLK